MTRFASGLLLSIACGSPAATLDSGASDGGSTAVIADAGGVVRIDVFEDGTFDPARVEIHSGATVEWVLHDPRASIIEADGTGVCPAPRSFDPARPNAFTGPLPVAPSGVWVISQLQRGLSTEAGSTCSAGPPLATFGEQVLCATGSSVVMDETWDDPAISGAFLRLTWSEVALGPGLDEASFDFRKMDALIESAVRNGRLYSLGFKAGDDGTPDWIFSTDADGTPRPGGGGGVQRLSLRDAGSDASGCGAAMDLGTPTDPVYREHYFNLLRAVARHVRARADWYRALGYIKPSGANLFSHENRLPKRCDPGCVCNTQILAEAGYTPTGLYEFYSLQLALLAEELPGKSMAYALIQDGFPSINDAGDYELSDGTSSGGALPGGVDQTEAILSLGRREQESLFVVQHNGLGPAREACPNAGMHPAAPPYGTSGGCPNRWVLRAGYQGQVTGFQTNNEDGVANTVDVEQALDNEIENSDGVFLELYEERVWEARQQGVLDATASGRTLAEWAELFHERRRTMYPELGDPYPSTHRHTFVRTQAGSEPETLTYVNGLGCDPASPHVGTIVILP